ncbi:hypothetical protein os4_35700 (plasmid) [Comamonadaceae bacterium OS-4]|nr:hypothetical protein os4_35700 [Comamonadaceae bacterium OS-4]
MTQGNTLVDGARALRMSGFFYQTLNGRGFRCTVEDLRWVLPQLETEQFNQVELAIHSLSKGHDQQHYMDLVATLRRLCDPGLRSSLRNAGIAMRVDVLFAFAGENASREVLTQALAGLRSTDAALKLQSEGKLRTWCGTMQAPDELPPLPPPLAQDSPEPAPAEPKPRAARSKAAATPAATGSALPEKESPALPAEAAIRRKAKAFGKAGALTLEIAPVRDQEHHASTARCTVMIEGALATGDGHYDWSVGSKVVFMCTQRELPQLLAVLMGWISELDFKFHGVTKKKSLHIEHQDHGLLVHLRDATHNVRVPVDDADRYALAMLVLAAMHHNEPHLDSSAIMAVARAMAVAPAWRRAG